MKDSILRPAHRNSTTSQRLTAIYERYHRQIRAFVYRQVGVDAGEDIVQETFLRLWRHIDEIEDDWNILAWLCKVSLNLIRDYARHERVRSIIVPIEDAYDLAYYDPEREDWFDLCDYVAGLDTTSQATLAAFVEGKLAGISPVELLGVNRKTYYDHMKRIRQRMAEDGVGC